MKSLFKLSIAILCMTCVVIITVTAISDNDYNFALGTLLGDYLNSSERRNATSDNNYIVASYNGTEITRAEIDYQRKFSQMSNGSAKTDSQILESIVTGLILKEEANRLGVSAEAYQVDSYMKMIRESYDHPEAKEMLDAYCYGAGIDIEEYFQIVEDFAPAIISKQNLRDEIGRQYCTEHGLEFTKLNPPQEMMDAIDAYIEDLFETHKHDIIYYIDIDE